MIGDRNVLAIIPARGGSKGVPRKNVADVAGKPLIAWTIEAAHASALVDRTIMSSEDAEIIEVARALGCEVPFVRPAELAADEAPGIAPVLHALEALEDEYGYVVLLQPTSPLRSAANIDACIGLCVGSGAPAAVSVVEAAENPYWMYTLDEHGRMSPFVEAERPVERRQDLPPAYALNGAVYVAERDWLLATRTFLGRDTVAYVMPPERSFDIDTPLDLRIVRALLEDA